MNLSKTILVCVAGLLLQGTASAQIYESEDAEGVTEFSDAPSAGAEVVDLPETNMVDPVDESAFPEQQSAESQARPGQAPAAVEEEAGGGNIYVGGDDDDDIGPREQRRVDEARVDNRLPGELSDGVENRSAADKAVMHPEAVTHPEAGHAGHPGGVRR